MALKLRIQTQNNQYVSASNSTVELLQVLLDVQKGSLILSPEEDDTLRGWLLLRSQDLSNGQLLPLEEQPNICIGKTADGRPFVRDTRGDWPPIKPEFD